MIYLELYSLFAINLGLEFGIVIVNLRFVFYVEVRVFYVSNEEFWEFVVR